MRGKEPENRRRWLARIAFWIGAGLLIAAAMKSIRVTDGDRTNPVDRAADGSVVRAVRVKRTDLEPTELGSREIERPDLDLIEGEAASIAAQDLPSERPLFLNLRLPTALQRADPLPARIISMDGGVELKLPDAMVSTDRNQVRVQIESGWLSTGRYQIEIEITEKSGPVVRRYPLEVR